MRFICAQPSEAFYGYDWYPRTAPNSGPGPRWRCNRSYSELGLAFTGSRQIGALFPKDWLSAPNSDRLGYLRWRVLDYANPAAPFQDTSVPWVTEQASERMVFNPGKLDPAARYRLEIQTLQPACADKIYGAPNYERWRDGVGIQGGFWEFLGFLVDPSYVPLPWPASPSPLYYGIEGDSHTDYFVADPSGDLTDAFVPIGSFTLRDDSAIISYVRRAVWSAAATLGRTPRGFHNCYGAWYGCQLEFPFTLNGQVSTNKANFFANFPNAIPWFEDIFDRPHLGAPPFTARMPTPQLIVYELSTNDRTSGRVDLNPNAYKQDIKDNITRMKNAWPGVKILMMSALTHAINGDAQISLMAAALSEINYTTDPQVGYFAPLAALESALGQTVNILHMPTPYHNVLVAPAAAAIVSLMNKV